MVARSRVLRSLFFLCLLSCAGFEATGALSTAAPIPTSSPSDDYAEQALETLLNRTNLHPRAFVEDHKIRVYFTNDDRICMLDAAWKLPRVKTENFVYSSAFLQAGKSPKPIPNTDSRWHELTVLPRAESDRLIHNVTDRLVPAEPGHGILCRFALGEATLYRNASGHVRLAAQSNNSVNVTIDRRYTRGEFASAAATELETGLRAAHPGQTSFMLAIGHGNQLRLVFLDLQQKQAVVLYVPAKADDKGRIGSRLANIASFIVVDNVFAFLKNPVTTSARAVNQVLQWPRTLFPRLTHPKSEIPPLTHAPGMDLAAWEQWLDHHAHAPRERGSVRLLIDGDAFFPAFERRVAEAQRGIAIHVCIIDRDDVATDMADRLKLRSTNVEVRVIFDRLMSRNAGKAPPTTPMRDGFIPPKSIAAYLRRDSEVRVRPQPNPVFTVDHTKVYLVDGRYAYIGGMNLGREYRFEWHDLMVEVQGPIVASYQRQFDKKWAQVGPWGDLGLASETIGGKEPDNTGPGRDSGQIELRRLYTKSFSRKIRSAQLAAINRASSYIFAENPYFYSNDILNALVRARRRGVDVRVILPSESDLTAGQRSSMVTANYLREHGIRVYLYPGMTHVKALLVDGWACFGSANFDALSLRLNGEADLATSDPAFAVRFRHDVFETDFERARELHEGLPVTWNDYLADALLNPL